ncbi:MAG: CHASE2 domain-containing protein [Elusimicrobia bacterium]|nr:CHASE2 domain-containing protein [Elusimicrobiota bacterium]
MKKAGKILHIIETLLTLGILWGILTYAVTGAGWLSGFENRWLDRHFLKHAVKQGDSRISIAAIDEKTIKELGWPFSRGNYGLLIEKLNKLGAKIIGIDVLFFEPYKNDASGDNKLIEAVKKAGNVVNLVAFEPDNKDWYLLKIPFSNRLRDSSLYVGYANNDMTLDSDGHIRKVLHFHNHFKYSEKQKGIITGEYEKFEYIDNKLGGKECQKNACDEMQVMSFAAALYAGYTGKHITEIYSGQREWSPKWLNFRKPLEHGGSYDYISVLDIIKGKLTSEQKEKIKGGIILAGSVALGTFDHYPSPFSKATPGVEFHSTSLDNLLNDDFLKPVSFWLMALIAVIFVWLMFFLRKSSTMVLSAVVAAAACAWFLFDYYMFIKGFRALFVGPFFGLFGSFVAVTVNKAVLEGREKKWIKNTFGQYLSPKVVEVITKDPSKLILGGEKRDMTVFFLDIAHFTSISEKMSPETLTVLLNKYLSGLTDVILKYDGVVDKFIGDCIMAFWNAPLEQKDHRTLACMAAIDCIAELEKMNKETEEFHEKPSVRIGLNSGPMVVGNMGSRTRFSYTVLGDAVNLGSRLEGANKFFSSRIMASEYTYEEAKDRVEARYLGQIRVIGKEIPVKVYELVCEKGRMSDSMKKLLKYYSEGMDSFYAGKYEKAQKAFSEVLKIDKNDGPGRFYFELAQEYHRGIPENWDGAFNLKTK